MTIYGLTAEGFNRKRLDDIISSLKAQFTTTFGAINTEPDSFLGQVIGIISSVNADEWEQLENVYHSQYPSSAEGVSLDNISELAGVLRLQATKTSILASVTGLEATLIPAGSIIRVDETNDLLENPLDGVITQGAVVACEVTIGTILPDTDYNLIVNGGPITYTSGGAPTVGQIADGLVAALDGSDEGLNATYVSGNTFTIVSTNNRQTFSIYAGDYLSITSRTSLVEFQCQESGPIVVLAGTVNNIQTPISGWTSVTNLEDGELGRDIETDTQYRARRALSLRILGSGSIESIRAKILQNVTGVTKVFIYENREQTEVDGRPPHSFETVVVGGSDADIGNQIWQTKPAGIQTFGNTQYDITDSNGDLQAMFFSRPTKVYIWIECEITPIDAETFPETGTDDIAEALQAYGEETFDVGDDVLWQQFFATIFNTVPGNIASVAITFATSATAEGPAGSYSADNIEIDETEISDFAVDRISVELA